MHGVQVLVWGRLPGQAVGCVDPAEQRREREAQDDPHIAAPEALYSRLIGHDNVRRGRGARGASAKEDWNGHQWLCVPPGSASPRAVSGAGKTGSPAKCISTKVDAAYAGRPSASHRWRRRSAISAYAGAKANTTRSTSYW